MKNIRYFTNGEKVVIWDREKCMHMGKCLKSIPYIIDKPGVYNIRVSDQQLEIILMRSEYCPAKALYLQNNEPLSV